jgi:transposase
VPKQNLNGGKAGLGSISKRGDRYLRVRRRRAGVIRYTEIYGTKHRPWLTALLPRLTVAAIALANGARGDGYRC